MLSIMISSPMVTMMNSENPNQPSIIAAVPTPLLTLPLPKSCATVDAATDAVCCHNTDTSTKIDEMKMRARAIWLTGREGNGFTSMSEPASSRSSCQPGKVARMMKQMNERTIATMLFKETVSFISSKSSRTRRRELDLQQVGKDDAILERLRHPYQIQRILIHADLLRQRGGVIAAQEAATIRRYADAKVAHSDFKLCIADDVGYCGDDAWIYLCGIEDGCVGLVEEGDEEDAGYEWGG